MKSSSNKKEYRLPEELKDIQEELKKVSNFAYGSGLNQKENQEKISQFIKELAKAAKGAAKGKFNEAQKLKDNSKDYSEEIEYLESINKAGYGILIESHYALDQENLAKLFYKIGELKNYQGDLSKEAKYYTDCSTACMYSISISRDAAEVFNKKIDDPTSVDDSYTLLSESYNKLVEICSLNGDNPAKVINQDSIDIISSKRLLSEIRNSSAERIKSIIQLRQNKDKTTNQDDAYVAETEAYFSDVAKSMRGYLKSLFEEAEEILGTPPENSICDYEVIGLGSMALQTMTPYSDLEFAILTENEDYKKNSDPKIRDYFKNLTHIVHFKNICLGETSIAFSDYDTDLDKYVKQAVNFDLGGKTPLGREDKPYYELIQTVDRMIEYAKNFEDKSEHISSTLPNILEKICLVHRNEKSNDGKDKDGKDKDRKGKDGKSLDGKGSNGKLADKYNEALKNFMESKSEEEGFENFTNYQYRAYKVLKLGVKEIDYISPDRSEKYIKGNLEQFKVGLDYSASGKLFDVKQEIYRMPDRFIYHLGKLFNVIGDNAWDTLVELVKQEKISEEASLNLQKALSFACLLRAQTYNTYKCQKEKISSLANSGDESEKLSKMFGLDKSELEVDGPLFEFYYTVIPLHQKLSEYCDSIKEYSFRKINLQENCYINNLEIKILICIRLMQWDQLIQLGENFLQNKEGDSKGTKALVLSGMTQAYLSLCNLPKALELSDQCLKKATKLNPLERAQALNAKGEIYKALSHYPKSLELLEEALEIRKTHLGEKNLYIANSLNNIGDIYNALGQHIKSKKFLSEALAIRQELLGDKHAYTANSFNNLGDSYYHLRDYPQSLKNYQKGLYLRRELFGEYHPDVSASLHNIGKAYNALGQFKEASKCSSKSISISREILGENHIYVAVSLNLLGESFLGLKKHKEALKVFFKSLSLYCKLLGKEHTFIAASFNNIGKAYLDFGNYKKSLDYYKQSLQIYKNLLEEDNPHVALIKNNLAYSYLLLFKYDKALKYITEPSNIDYKRMIEKVRIFKSLVGDFENCKEQIKNLDENLSKAKSDWDERKNTNKDKQAKCHYYRVLKSYNQEIKEPYEKLKEILKYFKELGHDKLIIDTLISLKKLSSGDEQIKYDTELTDKIKETIAKRSQIKELEVLEGQIKQEYAAEFSADPNLALAHLCENSTSLDTSYSMSQNLYSDIVSLSGVSGQNANGEIDSD